MLRINLTAEEKKQVEQLRNSSGKNISENCLIILLLDEGKPVKEITSLLKRHNNTVRFWIKRYIKEGITGLTRRSSSGRPKDKRQKVCDLLEVTVKQSPLETGYQDSVWTVPLLEYHFKKITGQKFSHDTIERALKDLGYSYKRPKKTLPLTAPTKEEKQKAFSKLLDSIVEIIKQTDNYELLTLDESYFSTEPYVVKGWFKKRWPPQSSYFCKKDVKHLLWMFESKKQKILLEAFSKS